MADTTKTNHRIWEPIWGNWTLLWITCDACLGTWSYLSCRSCWGLSWQGHCYLLPKYLVHREVLIVFYCAVTSQITRHTHILCFRRDILTKFLVILVVARAESTTSTSMAILISQVLKPVLVLRIEDLKHSVSGARARLKSSVGHIWENLELISNTKLWLVKFEEKVVRLWRTCQELLSYGLSKRISLLSSIYLSLQVLFVY